MSRTRAGLSEGGARGAGGGVDESKGRDSGDARAASAAIAAAAGRAGAAAGAAAATAAGAAAGGGGGGGEGLTLLFDACKREAGHPERNMKKFARRAKGRFAGGVGVNKDELTLERLRGARVAVFAAPKEPFSPEEVQAARASVWECVM